MNNVKRVALLLALAALLAVSQQVVSHYRIDAARCIGCVQCVPKCPVGAIGLVEGRAVIDPAKCIACGTCFSICPVSAVVRETDTLHEPISDATARAVPESVDISDIIKTTQAARNIYTTQGQPDKQVKPDSIPDFVEANKDTVLIKLTPLLDNKICISCGQCALFCPVGAIEMLDGKPVIDPEKCTACGTCVKICPVKALSFPEED